MFGLELVSGHVHELEFDTDGALVVLDFLIVLSEDSSAFGMLGVVVRFVKLDLESFEGFHNLRRHGGSWRENT